MYAVFGKKQRGIIIIHHSLSPYLSVPLRIQNFYIFLPKILL